MSEPTVEICFDAKNVLIKRGSPEPSSARKNDGEPLKRRAPKSPPKNKPRHEPTDD